MRQGYLFGFGAYALWGFFPLYFKLLRPSGALEVLALRIVWSMLFMVILLTVIRQWRRIGPILRRPKTLAQIGLAAGLIAANWMTYIWAVNAGHVVETSLGYFINPLIVIVLGVVVLGERLRFAQWGAVGVGTIAVVVLTVEYGQLPWIALILAVSFAIYGLTKKQLALPAVDGLLLESGVLAVPALGVLGWLAWRGEMTFGQLGLGHTLLIAASGAITAIPLLMFVGAANRIPLVGIGILQYIAPTIQLALGVFVFHEAMPPMRLFGFCLVWTALAIFTWDGLRSVRQMRLATATG